MAVRKDPSTGKAVEALYPDDPSNVHHLYLGDPVRFRNIHAWPKETHIFHLHAHQWLARDLAGPNGITYIKKYGLKDPAGIVFINSNDAPDIQSGFKNVEPLVLRANAGDCLTVHLTNMLPTTLPDYNGWNFMPMIVPSFNLNQLRPSNEVSLHPQLLEYDVRTSDGANVGLNTRQTAAPGDTIHYRWYAGKVDISPTGVRTATPIEYGVINLTDYGDIMKPGSHGAVGALVIEPEGATWTTASNSDTQAEVRDAAGNLLFKEFVLVYQDDLIVQGPNGSPVRNYVGEEDAEDSGVKGFNYKSEPLWARLLKARDGSITQRHCCRIHFWVVIEK